uniref:Uncharacterized protein n=1 Tax=Rhizophora mucronata TaxID=61149 RepID=A0A2P2NPZ7_RHIMU
MLVEGLQKQMKEEGQWILQNENLMKQNSS